MGLLLLITTMILGGIGSFAVHRSYKKWSKTQSAVNITGEQMARMMLASYGVSDVQINIVPGTMTDYFDPRDRTLNLSHDVATGTSVASHAIACHETGHYLQHKQGYAPLRLRHLLVPAANISSNLCWIVLCIGLIFGAFGLVYVAAALYAVALLFSVITLPVEFNASRRAVAFLDGQGGVLAGVPVPAWEAKGTRDMLRSAALTYVMSTLASVLNLLYILLIARGN